MTRLFLQTFCRPRAPFFFFQGSYARRGLFSFSTGPPCLPDERLLFLDVSGIPLAPLGES